MSRERFRYKGGKVIVTFSSDERAFLADVLDLLATIPATGDDPATQRLHVPVYLDDPDANSEWWRLMGDELSTARMSDRALFLRVIEGRGKAELTLDEADAFLRVVNEGRLALGARFGLEVEEDHDRLPEEQRRILDYLGWVLEELTSALTAAL
jgi:Domain of unknown function (DUF2017)